MIELKKPDFDVSLDNYYYNQVLRNYAIQFMAVFSGMQVRVGKNDADATTDLIDVPIRYGSMDKVVAAAMADFTQIKPLRIPALSARMVDLQYSPEDAKGVSTSNRYTVLPRGGSIPDDLKVIHRTMPVPYRATFELAIIASNSDQHFQILEQILLLFNPILQIQTSDDSFDWTKIKTIELLNINLEEANPAGTEKRLITSSIQFESVVYMSAPANIKNDIVKKIQMRIAAIPTWADTQKVAEDVNRLLPEYQVLFDVEDFNIPPK